MDDGERPDDDAEPGYPLTIFDYLMSGEGKEIANRVVGVIESIQKATLEARADQARLNMKYTFKDRWLGYLLQGVLVTLALFAVVLLSYYDKLNATTGLLMGTLVGYAFGRRTG